ncbi:hypothetical protein D9M70_483870 [compost metagenome]
MAKAGTTFSAIWLIGQFHGVISPQTPIGSRSSVSPLAKISRSAWPFSAAINASICSTPQKACCSRAMLIGAPISVLIACATSSTREENTAFNRSSRAIRSSLFVFEKVSNASFAAATAASTSRLSPKIT